MSRRWRYPRSRRGDFYPVILSATPTPPPAFVPAFQEPSGRNARLAASRSRRGEYLWVPGQLGVPVTSRRYPRQLLRLVRRGEFFIIPLTVFAAPAATWVPPQMDTRRPPARPARRGEFYTVPLVGAAPPPPPAYPPQSLRSRIRPGFLRRGSFAEPAWQQVQTPPATWTPQFRSSRRPLARLPRRGEYQFVPQGTSCPGRIASRRPQARLSRRGRRFSPPWLVIPPAGPGPHLPKLNTAPHKPAPRPTRRGVFFEPPWIGTAVSCTTPRPDSGTTVRPSSGSTSRPTGTTSRPSNGSITRPDSGVTGRPCA